jgi:SAM-dependent methyltransferase
VAGQRGTFVQGIFFETLINIAGKFSNKVNMFRLIKKLASKSGPDSEVNLRERFSQIYFKNIFGGKESRSGSGSDMVQTAEIRRELPKLIQEYGIRTFMDAPCGDWHWMKETALNVERYIGVDIVKPLIEKNRKKFGNGGTSFLCLDLATDELPQADIIFCRDCLVHLTYDQIRKVIANFKRSNSTYLLTTTFTGRANVELVLENIWRPLNLEMPPFNFPKPLKLINEKCTEDNNQYTDKSLGMWRLDQIN